MNWIALTDIGQLNTIQQESLTNPVVIFKHSTRCSISSAALARMERGWQKDGVKTYYLDLLAHRDISNAVAVNYGVEHQSPQVLVIQNGSCIYNESHSGIMPEEVAEHVSSN
ncbi:MAG: bacillithiol system redox-active protein YtxJ [Bacteroidia bacterium]|jgi:bacillithiol system protein YtxJ|nr:bacillithiol system redox-active protein YtxJ [Bacteroidia bacterium]